MTEICNLLKTNKRSSLRGGRLARRGNPSSFSFHPLKGGEMKAHVGKKDGLPRPFQGLAMTSAEGHSIKVYPPKGVVLLAMTFGLQTIFFIQVSQIKSEGPIKFIR